MLPTYIRKNRRICLAVLFGVREQHSLTAEDQAKIHSPRRRAGHREMIEVTTAKMEESRCVVEMICIYKCNQSSIGGTYAFIAPVKFPQGISSNAHFNAV